MKLADYIRKLDRAKEAVNPLQVYSDRCGITIGYMRAHVLHARKDPRFRLLLALARESDGAVSLYEVLEHFGVSPDELSATPVQAQEAA